MFKSVKNLMAVALSSAAVVQPLTAPAYAMGGHKNIGDNNRQETVEAVRVFDRDGVLYTEIEDGKLAVSGLSQDLSEVVIPERILNGAETLTVTQIASNAFSQTTAKVVELPATITEVKDNAFAGAGGLVSVVFAWDNQTEITFGDEAFAHCESLEVIVLPDISLHMGENVLTGSEKASFYRTYWDYDLDLQSYLKEYKGLLPEEEEDETDIDIDIDSEDDTDTDTDSDAGLEKADGEETDEESGEDKDEESEDAEKSDEETDDEEESDIDTGTGDEEEEKISSYTSVKVDATGWIKIGKDYKYSLGNDQFVTSDWRIIDGEIYYFDEDGWMHRGWLLLDGVWYFLNPDGSLAKNKWVDGGKYYVDENGVWVVDRWEKTADGGWRYYIAGVGYASGGWRVINNKNFFFDEYGMLVTGWLEREEGWYYIDENMGMRTNCYVGLHYIGSNGLWDSSKDKGQWIKSGSRWWYQHADGSYTRSGWETINGLDYYFDDEGWMVTGWKEIDGKFYYLYEDDSAGYPEGAKAVSTWIDGKWINQNGAYIAEKWITTGAAYNYAKMYRFGDGTYAKGGWYEIDGETYYFDANGFALRGWSWVNGIYCYFDSESVYAGSLDGNYTLSGTSWSYNSTSNNLHGVDISHWQDGIDVTAIPADFIIAKATGGTGYKDDCFTKYAAAAKASGKLFGMYHFARDNGYAGDAREEAEFFYSVVKDYIGYGVPILDWETDLSLGPDWVKEFLDRFYELSGVKCVIYTSASVTRSYNWSEIAREGYQLWLAQYAYKDKIQVGYEENPWRDSKGNGAFTSVLMHQYASTGRLPGYSGALDMDIFYGTRADWIKLATPDK